MDPRQIQIKDFSYELPDERIAKFPLSERDASKLLIYKNKAITEDIYKNLPEHLPPSSLLIFNNTRVIHARLLFENSKSEIIELFCLEPAENHAELITAMSSVEKVQWKCLVGRMNKWKEKRLQILNGSIKLSAELVDRKDGNYIVEFQWQPGSMSFAEIIECTGQMPIPPYLKRKSEVVDETRYQTIFADEKGSVAAPTAGLHFTKSILDKLKLKQIKTDFVTLHVGAGTFKPVTCTDLGQHEMHSEWIHVTKNTLLNIIEHLTNPDNNLIAVGTTSMRTLETLYWMGIKADKQQRNSLQDIEIKQWDAYELSGTMSTIDAMKKLLDWMHSKQTESLTCKTRIMIAPPYQLKMADALITNFHQPDSTLLLLVAAVVGEEWKHIYQYALNHNFRFLSYGDGSLLFTGTKK